LNTGDKCRRIGGGICNGDLGYAQHQSTHVVADFPSGFRKPYLLLTKAN